MKYLLLFSTLAIFNVIGMDSQWQNLCSTSIVSSNVDELVLAGIKHIKEHGDIFEARSGSGQQAYDVNYILLNPLNRVHTLRQPIAIKYFARELLAYFDGSLQVDDGLAKAASVWKDLADKDGNICSNYGYYVFHQKIPVYENQTQYQWAIAQLVKNLDSRKAFININQPLHKFESNKDFPCTLGMQFFIRKNNLCCSVSSRSTDIYTGLPYDIGFFSFVTELVYKNLQQIIPEKTNDLKLGYVNMKTNFTQIYDKTRTKALKLLENNVDKNQEYTTDMPEIYDAEETLNDIYKKTCYTPVMKWIYSNAKLEK